MVPGANTTDPILFRYRVFEQLARDTSRLTEADRVRRPGVGNVLGFARNFTTVPQADVEEEPTPPGERKIGELKKHLEESD